MLALLSRKGALGNADSEQEEDAGSGQAYCQDDLSSRFVLDKGVDCQQWQADE